MQHEEASHAAQHAPPSPDAAASVATGLDRMMLSLSDKSDYSDAAPSTVFSFSADPSFPAPVPQPAQSPAPTPAAAPVAKGALDVTAVLAESDAPDAPPVEEDGGSLSQQQLMKQLLGKKGKSASKSAAGARKLAISSTEVKLESFESEFNAPF